VDIETYSMTKMAGNGGFKRYPCIWQIHMGMEGIWVYDVELTWDCDSNAPVQWGVY
jgi:hypothetical protein